MLQKRNCCADLYRRLLLRGRHILLINSSHDLITKAAQNTVLFWRELGCSDWGSNYLEKTEQVDRILGQLGPKRC